MRAVATILLLLVLLAPAGTAGYGRGGTVGINYGYGDVGVWQLWYFDAQGGNTGFEVKWQSGMADYDLAVYPPGSLDDRALDEQPLLYKDVRAWGPASETGFLTLAPGRYVIAVIAHQSLSHTYELNANPGTLTGTYPGAVGIRGECPPLPLCRLLS